MHFDYWDFFEEQIATLVLLEAKSFPRAIGWICKQNPESSADDVLLGAISFVTHLDNASDLAKAQAIETSLRRYQVIAALSADIALISDTNRSCRSLMAFWQKTNNRLFDVSV